MIVIGLFSLWLAGLAAPETPADTLLVPDSRFAAGWSVSGSPEQYDTASLYQYLDGGADIVIEYGFIWLTFQRYVNREQELDLELYHMSSAEASMGLYLVKAGRETPSRAIQARNSVSSTQILTVQGSFVAVVTLLQGDSITSQVATTLAQELVSNLPKAGLVPLLGCLPHPGLISGSVRIVHGPLSTPPAFSAARGLIAHLCANEFGVAADYQTSGRSVEHRLFIPFPDSSAAHSTFEELKAPSDSVSLARVSGNQFTLTSGSGEQVQITLTKRIVEMSMR